MDHALLSPPPRKIPFLLIACAAAGLFAESAFAQPLNITLVRSNYNGYGVSCFGGTNGSIEAIVTGGTAPYTYLWSNQDTTAAISGLAAGYYRVTVSDADSTSRYAEITLSQPMALIVGLTPYTWPNGYNVSCHQCYKGSIQTSVQYGVPPYTYLWQDAITTQHRTAIGAGNYQLVVTDHNGCQNQPGALFLSEPADNNWDKGGNAGTDPEVDYLGTSDPTDFVLKSNGTELVRLLAGGGIKLGLPSGILGLDDDGELRAFLTKPWCWPAGDTTVAPWYTCGNVIDNPNGIYFIGTVNNAPLPLRTNNQQRMVITSEGRVGIGTNPPAGAVDGYRLFVEDGIATRDVLVKLGEWPDHVFGEYYHLMPIKDLRAFLKRHRHLPGIPSAVEVEAKGGVEVGDLQRRMLEVIEQQALYILQLEEKYQGLEQRIITLEASK
ncbi:MAG: SprB repeat-containing protein [Flavobacteriales bacterium]|nr:SprB repeat-containing protein [Flavobacteriales bacterium]